MITYLFLFAFLFQDTVPYKPEEEFNIKFEFGFRKRSDPNMEGMLLLHVVSSSKDQLDSSPLPYLKTTLEILKNDSLAIKYRIVRDNSVNLVKRKIEPGTKVIVFAAFVDDIRDKIESYQHTVFFLDKDGNRISKIVIEFDGEGIYSVNGKKNGKI